MSDLSLSSTCRSCGAYMLDTLSSGAHVGDTGSILFLFVIFNNFLAFLSKPKNNLILFLCLINIVVQF